MWVMDASQGRSQRFYHVEAHQKHWGTESHFTFQIANNEGADQTARMHRLVCALVVRKQQSQFFRRDPYDVEAQAPLSPPGYALASMSNIHVHMNGMLKCLDKKRSFACTRIF